MKIDRRRFVGRAGALLGAIGFPGILGAQDVNDGRRPITRAEWDRIIQRPDTEGFACVRATPMDEGTF